MIHVRRREAYLVQIHCDVPTVKLRGPGERRSRAAGTRWAGQKRPNKGRGRTIACAPAARNHPPVTARSNDCQVRS